MRRSAASLLLLLLGRGIAIGVDFETVRQLINPIGDPTERLLAAAGGGNYCPDDGVRRDQAAAFLLLTEHGAGYVPPACLGIFPDVPCPSMFADWIEQLVAEDISAGCGAGRYCPDSPSTRGQMAAFLVKTFGL
jgi:hypothetical protein